MNLNFQLTRVALVLPALERALHDCAFMNSDRLSQQEQRLLPMRRLRGRAGAKARHLRLPF